MLKGQAEVERNLERWYQGTLAKAARTMAEIADLLEGFAKQHHGTTPRPAGWVYPGGDVKRWREAGKGWGDVTEATTEHIHGFIAEVTPKVITAVLSAGMEYDVFLECARKGKWAWLWPAVEANLGLIKKKLEEIVQ